MLVKENELPNMPDILKEICLLFKLRHKKTTFRMILNMSINKMAFAFCSKRIQFKEYDIFTESGIDFYILTQDALRNNVDELEQCRYISQYILDNKNNEKIISNYRDVVRHTTVYIDTIDDDDIYQGKLKIQLHF